MFLIVAHVYLKSCGCVHAAVHVMQVVTDIVDAWAMKHFLWGTSKKELRSAVWEVGWRRHGEGTLENRIYFPQPVPFSNKEAEGEEATDDPASGMTVESAIISVAQLGRAVGSSETPDEHAHPEASSSGSLLLDTNGTAESR